MDIPVVILQDKGPIEKVWYALDFLRFTPFAEGAEAGSSANCFVYDATKVVGDVLPAPISAMVGTITVGTTTVTTLVGSGGTVATGLGGDTEGSYLLRVILTGTSGAVYEQIGTFRVVQKTG